MHLSEVFIDEFAVALIIFIIGSQFTIFGIVSAIMVHIRHIERQLERVSKRASDITKDIDVDSDDTGNFR